MFLKQIRPNDSDKLESESSIVYTVPHAADYIIAYLALIFAIIVPGTHHFVLRNNWRGLLYFLTFNEAYCGWFLDIFEMRVLVQRSVQEFGHINIFNCCVCTCWYYMCCCWFCCCFCFKSMCPLPSRPESNADGKLLEEPNALSDGIELRNLSNEIP